MEVAHAERKMLREAVYRSSVDRSARNGRISVREGRVRGSEVFGEVVKDRGEPIIFVKPGKGTSCKLERASGTLNSTQENMI